MVNTHIRVLPVTLIRVLGHTLVWVSVNYIYSYSLVVLMLYILFSIAIVDCRFRATFFILLFMTSYLPGLDVISVRLRRHILECMTSYFEP